MLVNVRYYKPQLNGYAGNAFTYKTALPLKVGDKVIAPTRGGDNRAMIVVDERVMPLLREITQYDMEEAQA